jgi:hypothetical protein
MISKTDAMTNSTRPVALRHPAHKLLARYRAVLRAAWAVFSKIDIAAVAQGRIVVSERTKTL